MEQEYLVHTLQGTKWKICCVKAGRKKEYSMLCSWGSFNLVHGSLSIGYFQIECSYLSNPDIIPFKTLGMTRLRIPDIYLRHGDNVSSLRV